MRCPTCKRASQKDGNKLYPFCCERCSMADLGKWLAEEYRVPGEPAQLPGATPSSEDES